jgi:hypothetical protein
MRRPLPIYIYMYVVGEHVLLQVWRTPIVSYRTKTRDRVKFKLNISLAQLRHSVTNVNNNTTKRGITLS